MEKVLGVHVLESLCSLYKNGDSLRCWKFSLDLIEFLEFVVQISSFHILHYEVEGILFVETGKKLDDVFMIAMGVNFYFPHDALELVLFLVFAVGNL